MDRPKNSVANTAPEVPKRLAASAKALYRLCENQLSREQIRGSSWDPAFQTRSQWDPQTVGDVLHLLVSFQDFLTPSTTIPGEPETTEEKRAREDMYLELFRNADSAKPRRDTGEWVCLKALHDCIEGEYLRLLFGSKCPKLHPD